MGLIDNFKTGVNNLVGGVEGFGKSLAHGDIKGAFHGATQAANGLLNASPGGVAINTLTHGTLQKMCNGEQEHLDKGVNHTIDGSKDLLKGLMHGDLKEAGKGAVEAGFGAFTLGRAATPLGVAEGAVGDGLIKPAITGESAAQDDLRSNQKSAMA